MNVTTSAPTQYTLWYSSTIVGPASLNVTASAIFVDSFNDLHKIVPRGPDKPRGAHDNLLPRAAAPHCPLQLGLSVESGERRRETMFSPNNAYLSSVYYCLRTTLHPLQVMRIHYLIKLTMTQAIGDLLDNKANTDSDDGCLDHDNVDAPGPSNSHGPDMSHNPKCNHHNAHHSCRFSYPL